MSSPHDHQGNSTHDNVLPRSKDYVFCTLFYPNITSNIEKSINEVIFFGNKNKKIK
jgi:hypothetical protein